MTKLLRIHLLRSMRLIKEEIEIVEGVGEK